MDFSTYLLNLEDEDIYVDNIVDEGPIRTIVLKTHLQTHFCPLCGFKMHSRGIKKRKIKHPVTQDGREIILELHQRRWKCTNPECNFTENDEFNFVNKRKRTTNATDMMIINALRNLTATAADVAAQFNVSDTYVIQVFNKYVKLDRLPLSDIISIDEVYLGFSPYCKYSLVIQDFYTGDPIDLVLTRINKDTEPYFVSIPREERCKVKYLISDMYAPYINYIDKYFPNAVSVVDSFHVIQWIVRKIEGYIRSLVKEYKQRDKNEYIKTHPYEPVPKYLSPSREVYVLNNYRWLVLSNQNNITYYSQPTKEHFFNALMNTYDCEDELFRVSPRLRKLRDLKEMYITFNNRNYDKPMDARIELDELIDVYLNCGDSIFVEFAEVLIRNQEYILNSFVVAEKYGKGGLYTSRLSNGPIESLNRKIKDLKRMGRGYKKFEHFRNRFLFATRQNPVINGSSKSKPVKYYN